MSAQRGYLGDGVYYEFDGYMTKLWTDRETGVHYIYLEPESVQRLVEIVVPPSDGEDE